MNPIKKILIVGGGTAGWITAGILAAEYSEVKICLIESPNINTVGVGEGTWPTMRDTLQRMGIKESEFLNQTNASFKQGSKFVAWRDGSVNDVYYHPFDLPQGYFEANLAAYWQKEISHIPFATAFSTQVDLCKNNKAPKQFSTPEYAAVTNYAYHLDAGKFSQLLKKHCVQKLKVDFIADNITSVVSTDNGDIDALNTEQSGEINADLFIDCTGHRSLLLGKHYQIPLKNIQKFSFNNKAIAVHVPYKDAQSTVSSATVATAQDAGWIWDIALSNRRGVGYVYSEAYSNEQKAEDLLRRYISPYLSDNQLQDIQLKKLSFTPGYREKFWHKNCVAIGMSAGFIEPLEASAIALVELSAKAIRDQLPVTREMMTTVAKRFNQQMSYRWERVIDFLKLHYVLSQRDNSLYWKDNKNPETIPDSLKEMLKIWKYHTPSIHDLNQAQEIFPTASYQYVLYGMGFKRHTLEKRNKHSFIRAEKAYQNNVKLSQQYLQGLPTNRELLDQIKQRISS